MSKRVVVELCDVPQYKLSIEMKRMVWYRQPLSTITPARLSLYQSPVTLHFANSMVPYPREAVYHIPNSDALAKFYSEDLVIEFVNAQNQVIGVARWDPRVMTEKKSMIGPVLSRDKNQKGCPIKLGDVEIMVSLKKTAVDLKTLRQVKHYLEDLETRPCQMRKLYDTLKHDQYI